MSLFGEQVVLLLKDCSDEWLRDNDRLFTDIDSIVQKSGLHTIKAVRHDFDPQGLTVVWILAESHLMVHTWPEYYTVIVDLFVCQTDFVVEKFVAQLQGVSKAEGVETVCSFQR